ncbi:hypothetical protein FY136_28750 (plasmid) [Agrobacterium tumefaciens]|uniref:hypothetical protein n=1 Tax=Agrobacterium tumefaciens TaxID=358 RepID=UPI0021D1525D|nr:hypothetical protein [Agrobacterium tumefaciens]UXT53253.1 hypothetical protein FY136_28750 [Agrobacterium tumefaciens]
MQKTIVAALTVALLAGAAPARAGDGAGIAIGFGVMLLEHAIKSGAGKGGQRQSRREPGRGDTLIGRVEDGEPSGRSNAARGRNKVAPAGALAALPETGPVVEFRPNDAEIAQLLARPIPQDDGVDQDATTAAIDGGSTAKQLSSAAGGVEVAQAMNPDIMSPPTDTFADGSDGSELLAAEQPQPKSADKRDGDYGTVWNRAHTKGSVFDENNAYWLEASADVIAKIDAATASGMKRSEAISANTDLAAPGKTKSQAAAELAQKQAAEKKFADAQAKAKADADAEAQRVADVKAAKENARLVAEAEAAAKAKAETERQQLEAAYPGLAAKVAPVTLAKPPVDEASKTSSVSEPAPVSKPAAKAANPNLDL